MLSFEEALERVFALTHVLEEEPTSVDEAIGRAAAHEVRAVRTLPPWDDSAMDGYAVRSMDVAAGAELRVVARIFAGDTARRTIGPSECARIMTGAVMPAGADAVVMQEKVTVLSDDRVRFAESVAPGTNVRRRGEDIAEGAALLPAGAQVGLAEAGLLWAQGISRVRVRRRPTVAIATSGDELSPVPAAPGAASAPLSGVEGSSSGTPFTPGVEARAAATFTVSAPLDLNAGSTSRRIIDSNSPVIAAAVRRAGGVPTALGIAPDRLDALVETFARGLKHDVLIAIAGASVGERDYTRDAFARLGVEADFWKVAMKPGKPLALGRFERDGHRTLVFGLPGNPVSAMVTFELFVRPALRRMQGLPPCALPLPARAAVALSKPRGLRTFLRARVEARDGQLWASPAVSQSSGALTSAVGATHLISLPPDSAGVPAGGEIVLIPLAWAE